jgi:hypothetical protein
MNEASRGAMRQWLWIPFAILVVVGAGLAWRSIHAKEQHTMASAPVAATAPVVAKSSVPSMPAEPEADAMVSKFAAGLSSSARYASWLQMHDLARLFVSAVNSVAEGDCPVTVRSFLAPKRRFEITERHGHTFINPQGYKRFDDVADVIASFDVKVAASAYAGLHSLLTAAYAEIGQPGTTLDGRLAQAIQVVEATKAPAGQVELVGAGVNYKFADQGIEGLSPVSKLLVRVGPRNLKLIQDKLRELAAELHLSPVAVTGSRGAAHPG